MSVWSRLGAILRAQTWTGDRGNTWRPTGLIHKGRRGAALLLCSSFFYSIALGKPEKTSSQLGGLSKKKSNAFIFSGTQRDDCPENKAIELDGSFFRVTFSYKMSVFFFKE